MVTDAADNSYHYIWDGAGRLLQSRRAAPNGPVRDYYAFDYDGAWPVAMYRGNQLVSTWAYDNLARVQTRTLDPGTADQVQYTLTWDTRWLGARSTVTDGAGQTDWHYDDNDGFGQLGRVSRVERSWSDGFDTQTFDYGYTFEGQVQHVTWPSGAEVDSAWQYGFLVSDTLTYGESLAQQVTVDHSYDNFGLPAGWMRGNDMGVAVSRQLRDPNRIERMDW